LCAGVVFLGFFQEYKVIPVPASGGPAAQLIRFGRALLFSECAFWALSHVDRYLIVASYDGVVLGLYSAGNMPKVWLTLTVKLFVGCLIVNAGALYREKEILGKLQMAESASRGFLSRIAVLPHSKHF